MQPFGEKAIFVWNNQVIAGGDPAKITQLLVDAGFEAAYLHWAYLHSWRTVERVELIAHLKQAGLRVYGSAGVYGVDPAGEGRLAAAIVNDYHLAGFVFDAETGWDSQSTPDSNAVKMLQEYKARSGGAPAAWCWWPFWKDPVDGVPQWHPVNVLRTAMQYADVGLPMAYWFWGDDPASAVRFLNAVWEQWRAITPKPLVIAGRACTGDGGTAMPDAIEAFESRARELGAAGMSWWSMEHALDQVHLPGVWAALAKTPKFNSSIPTIPDEPTGDNMWEKNALIAAFDPLAGNPAVETIDFAALKADGIHAVLLRCGQSNFDLNYDDPSANFRDNPKYPAWFQAATAAGLRVLVEYPFNAMLDSVNEYSGSRTLQHINYCLSGGKKPAKGGGLILTLEHNTWKETVRPGITTCTSPNFGKDLENVFNAIWNAHKLVPAIRTGRWFLDKTDESGSPYRDHLTWMDKGEDALPLFMARPRKTGNLVTGDFHALLANIADPATTTVVINNLPPVNEQAHFLYFGNETQWSGWEVAWVRHAAVKGANGQPTMFRMIVWDGDTANFDAYFNFPASTTPDPEEPEEPGEPEEPTEDKWEVARKAGYAWVDALIEAGQAE